VILSLSFEYTLIVKSGAGEPMNSKLRTILKSLPAEYYVIRIGL
jgi:hypothetical protein